MVTITSPYGWRTIFGRRNFHRGLDYRSRRGDARVALWSGTVVKITRGRAAGAGIGRISNGVPAHAPTLSGNAVTIRRDGGGYYVEVHIDPAARLKVGERVTAGSSVLGFTDLSGSITAAHGHVELWQRNHHDTYFDPTTEFKAATSGRGSATAPEPAPEPEPERKAPNMLVVKWGRSKWRLVTGDRMVAISEADADRLTSAGIPTAALDNATVENMQRTLIYEGE